MAKPTNQAAAFALNPGIYALAGICKNAGKTTLLNWLLENKGERHLGVMTTGRDGETVDSVFGNSKPAVQLPDNTLFTAATQVINQLGFQIEVIDCLPFTAANQQLWLARTLYPLEAEITGPPSSLAQIKVARQMQTLGAETVLIDGSLDRKSIALQPEVKGIFLVIGSSFGGFDQLKAELERLIILSKLPVNNQQLPKGLENYISCLNEGNWQSTGLASLINHEQELLDRLHTMKQQEIYLPGALTDSVFTKIRSGLDSVPVLLVRHALNLHLSRTNLNALMRHWQVNTVHAFRFNLVALNSWAVDGNHLDSNELRRFTRILFPNLPVIDIKEG